MIVLQRPDCKSANFEEDFDRMLVKIDALLSGILHNLHLEEGQEQINSQSLKDAKARQAAGQNSLNPKYLY